MDEAINQLNKKVNLLLLDFTYLVVMAKDFYHKHVREALEKSGWTITHDPYPLATGVMDYEVDYGAEQLFAAEKGPEKIAIEVKNFIGQSPVNELHKTVGQFVDYRAALRFQDAERTLFIAIPAGAWSTFFQREPVIWALQDIKAKIMVFDEIDNKIVKWINMQDTGK